MKAFFDAWRAHFGALSQSQVDGLDRLLAATQGLPRVWRAYILATVWHETGQRMAPITEFGGRSYFDCYEPGTAAGRALGNTTPGDGWTYRGRGYVQITGRANYAKAGGKLGRNLLLHPEQALDPAIAATILVRGMIEGWFTGVKLADCADYHGMRRVVNGLDKAALIATYALAIEPALKAAELPPDLPDDHQPPAPPPRKGFLALILELLLSIFRRTT